MTVWLLYLMNDKARKISFVKTYPTASGSVAAVVPSVDVFLVDLAVVLDDFLVVSSDDSSVLSVVASVVVVVVVVSNAVGSASNAVKDLVIVPPPCRGHTGMDELRE